MFTTVRAGTNVTLNCTDLGAAGPGDTVSWAGGGQLGDTLPLIRVDQSHSGVYTCAVSRGAEGDRLLHVSLLVSHPPALTSPRYRVAQQLGRPVQLDCEVKIQHILKLLKYFICCRCLLCPCRQSPGDIPRMMAQRRWWSQETLATSPSRCVDNI